MRLLTRLRATRCFLVHRKVAAHNSPLPLFTSLHLNVVRMNAFHSARNLHAEHNLEGNSSLLTAKENATNLIDIAAIRGDMRSMIEAMTKEAIDRHGTTVTVFSRLNAILSDSGLYSSVEILLREVAMSGLYREEYGAIYEKSILSCSDPAVQTEMLKNMVNLNIKPSKDTLERISFKLKESGNTVIFANLLNVLNKQRFIVPESMYFYLLDMYIKFSDWNSALNLFRFWNDKMGLKIKLTNYEDLIYLLVKNEKYLESLSVFEIAKKNGYHQHNLEIRLLLKTEQFDKLLGVFRNAIMLNCTIDENVAILYVRKLFELLQNEKLNFSYISDNLQSLNEEHERLHKKNNQQESTSEIKIAVENIELLIQVENEKLNNCLKVMKNVLCDLEEVTSNLVYVERGSNESFSRMIRLWREGGVEYKERYETILLEMVKSGVEPKMENYRELLGLNDEKLYSFVTRVHSNSSPTAKAFAGVVEYLERGDISSSVPLSSKLNEVETDTFICDYLRAMSKNNELGSLPALLSALSCITRTENATVAFDIFEKNIKEIIKRTNDSIVNDNKNSNIKVDANSKAKSWNRSKVYTTFNVISIPDSAVQTLWTKLIGEFSFICFRNKSEDLIKKYENIMKLHFHPDTIQLANYHRNLILYTTRASSIIDSDTNVTLNSSILDTEKAPVMRSNFTKFPETKSEKALSAITRISKNFFWCGVPYTTHYNLALQACKNANKVEDIHHLIRVMRYNVRANKVKFYTSPDSKPKDVHPKIVERLNSTTYEIFMNAMQPTESNETIGKSQNNKTKNKNTDKEKELNNSLVPKSTKNENEIILLALEFSNQTLLNNSITDKLTRDLNDEENWARKFTNISIIRLLEKAFQLSVRDAMEGSVRSNEIIPNDNDVYLPICEKSKSANISSPPKEERNAREGLKNAVTIFNAISLCNFPHAEKNYRKLLRAYLRLVSALNEKEKGKGKKKDDDNDDSDKDQLDGSDHENEINMSDTIETEKKNKNEIPNKSNPKRKYALSDKERIRYLEDAVDLFEGMCSTKLPVELDLGKSLMLTIVNSKNDELLSRLITASPFSYIVRTPISGNINTIFRCLSDLKKHQELLEFSAVFSAASRVRVQEEFSNIKNWQRIITAVHELKNDKTFEDFEPSNTDEKELNKIAERKSNVNEISVITQMNEFPFEEKVSLDFLLFLNRKTSTHLPMDKVVTKTASNIIFAQNGILTKTDQLFVTTIENCSKVRIFVDNNQLVLDIVDILVEKGLPHHALSFLKKAIEDCEFSAPKNKYETRSMTEIKNEKKVFITTSQRNQLFITNRKDKVLTDKYRDLRNLYAPHEMLFSRPANKEIIHTQQ